MKTLPAVVAANFPMIRETHIVCEVECSLVMALGDQRTGLSPFDGNLERFLVAQGYAPNGPLVVDQPGDNDNLLTIPVALPTNIP